MLRKRSATVTFLTGVLAVQTRGVCAALREPSRQERDTHGHPRAAAAPSEGYRPPRQALVADHHD